MAEDVSKVVTGFSEDELLQRHKKERKELQCKIQSLKKTSTKGDKKKKKEVAEEIARLESELDQRHNDEVLELKERNVEVNCTASSMAELNLSDDNEELAPRSYKISKAQKRRDKKAIKEKVREQAIKAQEVENVHGARNVETKQIKEILRKRNLMIHDIPSDGNCLYCAIDYQLNDKLGLDKLRMLTSNFLRQNISDFLPFLSHPETGDVFSEEQYEEYCNQVAHTSAWGGEVELRALSHILQCPIEVLQATGPPILVGQEYCGGKKPVVLTYHRHMYGLGEHYNAVRPYEEPPEEAT